MDVTTIARAEQPTLRLVSLVVARQSRVALALAGADRWRENQGYIFMPAELPGAALESAVAATECDLLSALDGLAHHVFGQSATVMSSRQVYGPSAAHAIDRLTAATDERPVPVLRLERGAPLDTVAAGGPGLRRVELRAYLARLEGEPVAGEGLAGILWISPAALRTVMRGMQLAEALALPGVAWQPAAGCALPDEAFVYVPGEYGERHLVRVAAKYGAPALFQDDVEPKRGA